MKRKSAIILALVLAITAAAGCAGSTKESSAEPESLQETSTVQAPHETEADSQNESEVKKGEYVGFDGVDPDISAEITIYRHYADADKINVDGAIAKMKEKYPNLVINIEHRSDSDGTALKTWAAVGELPDIFENTAADAYQSMLDNGDLYVMDEAIEATGFYDLFTNGKISQEGHTNADGHQYSMACEVDNVLCIRYNKELFAELGLSEPTNFEEFKHSITVLQEADKIPFALFGAEQWPAMSLYSLAVVAEGEYAGVDALADGTATIESEPFSRAAEKFQEIVDMGVFGKSALSTNYQHATEMLSTGQAGYMVNGTWFWQTTEEEGFADKIDWCSFNVFADADASEEVQGRCVGGKVREHQHSVNANPPSGLDPYIVSLIQCEFEYYFRLNSAKQGNMTTVIGEFDFKGGEAYENFNQSYGSFKSFNTLPADISNAELVTYLGSSVEMMVSGNSTAGQFVEEMKENGF